MKSVMRSPRLVLLILAATGWSQDRPALRAERPKDVVETVSDHNPYSSEDDVEAGQKLFIRRCAQCHGIHGGGGRGVNLTTGQYRLGGSDRRLFLTIRNGIPDSEMPGSTAKTNEIWRLVAYVKQIGTAETSEKSPGDPAAGRAIYDKIGCSRCHRISGSGNDLGPELTGIGRRRSLQYLRDSIIDPGADIPTEYRSDTVTPLSGGKIRGIHLNEDDYSIQIRDTKGDLRCFLKTELHEIKHDRDSLMPEYRSLSSIDLDNLVAYLKSIP